MLGIKSVFNNFWNSPTHPSAILYYVFMEIAFSALKIIKSKHWPTPDYTEDAVGFSVSNV